MNQEEEELLLAALTHSGGAKNLCLRPHPEQLGFLSINRFLFPTTVLEFFEPF